MEVEAREETIPPPPPVDFPAPAPLPASDPNQKTVRKPTRQWAAWTRQEEQNFFNALRQVGKNFEKITLRVQSKNKDQVRHYYYRLVRRMKKLLGPEFSLDAKNSKDTIAAMLRWWSLLEKFSCSASKLHLKPRRFKTFVEALGNQLLKDRNKTRRKCPRGDVCLSSSSSVLNRTPGNESFSVKFLPVDVSNGSKVASSKGAFFKKVAESNCNNKSGATKGDLSATRTVKQKRRAGGGVASAAYKKWERAAMAGVSLVADAAEELERNTVSVDARMLSPSSSNVCTADDHIKEALSQNHIKEADQQAPAKLKLQLFPINDATRKALEKGEHNPHLELTLSARKKISSVLEHLNRKWGNSSIASGELLLFPYCAHQEDLATYQRWTTKDNVAVADVFLSVNSPSVFRLRYGWFSLAELEAGVSEISLTHFENCLIPEDIHAKSPSEACVQKDGTSLGSCVREQHPCNSKDQSALLLAMSSSTGKSAEVPEQSTDVTSSQLGRQKHDQVTTNQVFEADPGMDCTAVSEGEWADTLTDISVGYLLTEASRGANTDCPGTSIAKNALFLENPCSYDSFDAAVALHASRYKAAEQPALASHSTIWGAEETCDEFSFSVASSRKQEGSNNSASSSPDSDCDVHPSNSEGFQGFLQDLAGADVADNPCIDDAKDLEALCAESPPRSDNDSTLKDQSLADLYWPDSLGPLDLEIPSATYHADDLLLGDSQNSWNRIMANSLDAFRNLSFFTTEKNDSIPSIM
ncbi:TSL-kinase interacting protein 1 [Oryza brachyantha]|uniref:Uncharacterized protein n=1 Tax=Oryza brachyantha TaxID=4533 RepID=J3LLU8_ORYBR|nr:TSL-kinase interacting protein 1 [Oryza brachyantha]XP_015690960.1 TSL-kinase interacting protein 1 [Oryza brachyantha]